MGLRDGGRCRLGRWPECSRRFLGWTTFAETRETNAIARAEAERNAREAEAARQHTIRTERAIIDIERVHAIFHEDFRWIELSLTLNNRGKSNAWDLQIFTAEQNSKLFPKKLSGGPASSLIVHGGGTRAKSQTVRIKVPKAYPTYVFGYLAYTTAREANFRSYFCCKLFGVPNEDQYGDMINVPIDARNEVELPPNT